MTNNRLSVSAILVVLYATVAGCRRGATVTSPVASPATVATGAPTSFDLDWRFHAGDVADGESPTLDDAGWQPVDLPHDFMIRGAFDPQSPGGASNGYLNGGIGWYRKTFALPAADSGKRVVIDFDGVYMNSEAWINGVQLGVRPYGYSSFRYDLTPHVRFGQRNVIAVRVNVQQPSSRWYSGAGIYRHVRLSTLDPVHFEHWGIIVTTPEITDSRARVHVRVTMRNESSAPTPADVAVDIRDAGGNAVARSTQSARLETIARDSAAAVDFDLDVPNPHRWSTDDPYLYTVGVRARAGDRDVDATNIPLGIRTAQFTADGFFLNGVRTPFRGVCLHHDLGPLGAAAFDRGIERELQIMKRMGVNAIRTSHNPPAPALLDLADRMGFVVMDEAFDEWKQNKTRFGYGQFFDQWSERDIRDMVRRDRNHPSVVMWSIGNEIPEQRNTRIADSMATRLATFVRAEDATRPVTAAMNSPTQALSTGFARPLDAFGVNYNLNVYPRVQGRPAYASETSSNYSSRDQYNLVLDDSLPRIQKQLDNHSTSYDLDAPRWGNTAERQFQAMRDSPWISGEFVWTGVDYIGEPTPFSWPNRSSSFGIVDLAGFPKDRFYLYQSQWTHAPMVHLLPHWNWPAEFRGKPIPVWVYTNADSVELFLNERSVGVRSAADRPAQQFHLAWEVPYEPGTLRAVAMNGGRVVAEDRVETTGPAARLELTVDRPAIHADGQDLAYVTVRVVDAQGRLVRAAGDAAVDFTLTGGGSIAGVDNGDPTNHERFVGPTPATASHRAFNGLEIVVVRAPSAGAEMTLRATAAGLGSTQTRIVAR